MIRTSRDRVPPTARSFPEALSGRLRIARLLLLLAAAIWCTGMFASPLAARGGATGTAVVIRMLYAPICHQDPARSCSVDGYPWTLCNRCAAVSLAFTALLLFWPAVGRLPGSRDRRLHLALLLPIALDWLLGAVGVWENTALSRATSGALAGMALAALASSALEDLMSERRDRSVPVRSALPND